jgi:hypothetical protein
VTKREQIAAMILQGLFSNGQAEQWQLDIPFSVMLADKLLAELERTKPKELEGGEK